MFENKTRTELNEFGTFKLMDHLAKSFETRQGSTVHGIGEDAAVIDSGEYFTLVSSILVLEGIQFDLSFHPLKHLGYKTVVNAISNIYAMNGTPTQIIINIGLSNRFSLEAVEEFYLGVQIACETFTVDLVGGNVGSSQRGLMAAVTSIGRVEKDKICYRKGANVHDLLVVSGDLGGAYMGLKILEREKKIYLEQPEMQPDLEKHDYIVGRQLKPEARADVIELLGALNVLPTSMILINDGVAGEIQHMGKASKIGFDIYENKLPIDPQTVNISLEFGLNPSVVALNGGEDFELLFTVPPADFEKIKNNPDLSIIGHATEMVGKYRLINEVGNDFDITAQGWQSNITPNNM